MEEFTVIWAKGTKHENKLGSFESLEDAKKIANSQADYDQTIADANDDMRGYAYEVVDSHGRTVYYA